MLATFNRQMYSRRFSVFMKPYHSMVPNVFYSSYGHRFFNSSSKSSLPEGLWDSHVHIIEPKKYPFPKNIKTPHEGTMAQALANAERLGLPNMVFVQLSTYGNDNAWVLDALKEVGPSRGRGVVGFDPEHIDSQTLQQWHDLGVRGVRLNLRSSKTTLSKNEIQTVLRQYAEKLQPMKTWSIGLYADMEVLDYVQPLLSELQVKMVLEHFASPAFLPLNPARQPGWDALNRMMEDSRVYVKISAPYLFSKDPEFKDLESLAKSFLSMRNGEGVVFASDWPHTQARGFDAKPFMDRCIEWCNGDTELQKKLFQDNAKDLWDIK
jgi:predicted TIM-barrel fold metal-dependent hydrolase